MQHQGKPLILLLCFCLSYCLATRAQGIDSTNITASRVNSAAEKKDTLPALVMIADVSVTGYKKTKLYIIEREIPFKRGDYLSRSELQKKMILCHDQLMNTSLFVDVEVTLAEQKNELSFIDVKVKERWYLFPLPYFKLIDRNLNQWWVEQKRSLNRVNYGLKFMQENVSGRNDKLNIWLINGYTQQASFRYENPFLDKNLHHGLNIGVSYSRNHEINYATEFNKQQFAKNADEFLTRQFHADLAYSYRPAIKARHTFRVAYTNQRVPDTVLQLNPDFFADGTGSARYIDFIYSLQYFDVDYISYPLKGFMGDAAFTKRWGIGSKNEMWQIEGKGTYSFEIFPKSYINFQGAGLLRLPFNQPYANQRIFGSGDMYLRGLEYYVIDGVVGALGRVTARKQLISAELRSPVKSKSHDKIPFRVFLKGYGDAGYAYIPNPVNSLLNNKWLKAWGAGLDIVTFYDVVLKLEYSFNQFGQGGLFIHTKTDF